MQKKSFTNAKSCKNIRTLRKFVWLTLNPSKVKYVPKIHLIYTRNVDDDAFGPTPLIYSSPDDMQIVAQHWNVKSAWSTTSMLLCGNLKWKSKWEIFILDIWNVKISFNFSFFFLFLLKISRFFHSWVTLKRWEYLKLSKDYAKMIEQILRFYTSSSTWKISHKFFLLIYLKMP